MATKPQPAGDDFFSSFGMAQPAEPFGIQRTGGKSMFGLDAATVAALRPLRTPDGDGGFREDPVAFFKAPDGRQLHAEFGHPDGTRIYEQIDTQSGAFSTRHTSKYNGRPYEIFDPESGAFKGDGAFSGLKDSMAPALASALVAIGGPALGMAATAAFAGGAAAGGVAAGGAGAATAAEALPTFGVVDTAAFGAGAGGAAALPTFGVVDTSAFAPAAGESLGSFGVVDQSIPWGFGDPASPTFGVVDKSINWGGVAPGGGSGGAAKPGAAAGKESGSLFDTLTNSPLAKKALEMVGSGLISKMIAGGGSGGGSGSGASATPPPPVSTMPDPLARIRDQQQSLISQLTRRGRESTVLTRRA